MAREKNQVPETRGWAELGALLKAKNQKDLAEEAKVSQSVISEVLNRVRLPSMQVALALQKLGIDPAAWGEPPPAPTPGSEPRDANGDAA